MLKIPIEISARHIHLAQKDLEVLFGLNYQLTPIKKLSQHNQFVCEEKIEIQNLASWGAKPHMDFTFGKAPDHNQVRILGPAREYTQVELSWTDFIYLGLKPFIALSGEQKKSQQELILVGPKGEIKLQKGVIIAKRHIHASPTDLEKYHLKDGQKVSVKIKSQRGLIFNEVIIRSHPSFVWTMHIDTDEANAAGLSGEKAIGEVITKKQ